MDKQKSDLIYRQTAIDAIEQIQVPIMRSAFEYEQFIFKGMCEALNAVKELPSAQQWIPCSEKLPEAQTEVNVSCTDDSGDTKFRYTSSGWITTDKEYWIVDNEINNFVVAWMPLPEPYNGTDMREKET